MGLCNILKRIRMVNPNIQVILHDEVEQLCTILLILLSCVDVIEECRSYHLDIFR